MRYFIMIIVFCLFLPQLLNAQITIGKDTEMTFASVDQGKKLLSRKDDFAARMSPFDRAARMKTDKPVSEAEFLNFVQRNVLSWNADEKQRITSLINEIKPELIKIAHLLPSNIVFVKTTGKEEGGAAYTRSHAIILPQGDLTAPKWALQKTLCHEIFHIISRTNPLMKEKFYRIIGFEKCNEIDMPKELSQRKITNPDAPINDHCIKVQYKGVDHWVIPVIFSVTETYQVKYGGEFFDYLQFKFLVVDRSNGEFRVKPIRDSRGPKLLDERSITGFYEQIGRNTGYIIHPEEVLADNFAFLLLKKQNLSSPEIIRKMNNILISG